MLVFDRVGVEDAQPTPVPSSPLKSADLTVPATPGTLTLPTDPPTELQLSLSALDAYSIFSDLCLLTLNASPNPGSVSSFLSLGSGGNKEKPRMLKLSSLNRTFGLELIESVLSGFENGVKKVRSFSDFTDLSTRSYCTSCDILSTLFCLSCLQKSLLPFQSPYAFAASCFYSSNPSLINYQMRQRSTFSCSCVLPLVK